MQGSGLGHTPKKLLIGERAYRLREVGGLWGGIAFEVGISSTSARDYARMYAKHSGSPWPLPKPLSESDQTLAARVYETLASGRDWSKTGQPGWKGLSVGTGMNRLGLAKLVQRYAEREGLPWPIRHEESPQEVVYRLREGGLTWSEIHQRVGEYKHVSGVIRAARLWAKKNDLSWPVT